MRVMLKLVLDTDPDTAFDALQSPAVFRAVSAPFTRFTSREPGGFPERWPGGPHRVLADAFDLVPMGEQVIDITVLPNRGVTRLVRDDGGGRSGMLGLMTTWRHTMAVAPDGSGRTLFRDRLEFGAGWLTPLLWPSMWVFWQWRAFQMRRMAPTW